MRPALPPVAAALLLLAGCELPVAGLVENNNYRTSGRSISGWAMSALSDQDCEPMRVFERKPVCRDLPPPPPVDPVCYKSLADVTCYTTPDPAMPPGRLRPGAGQAR